MKKKILITCATVYMLLLSIQLYAQQRTISGKVVDKKDGQPMPGVSVKIKGGAAGMITTVDGAFSLNVNSDDDVLTFSFIGYQTQEVSVKGKTAVTVEMIAADNKLNEIVVVGYGQQARRYVTGAVAKVDMKQTENSPATSFTEALRGRVAGVQFTDSGRPGQNGSFQIRGVRTLSGSQAPLIVLDGVFFNGAYSDINSNDIASIEVLKDASATAIYGSKAANGVILITTKKGTTTKPSIAFNSFYGKYSWSHKVKLYSPDEYLQRILDYRAANGQASDPAQIRSYLQTTEQQQYDLGQTVDPWNVASQENPSIQKYDLSVSGKSDRVNYFLSGGYVHDQGLILNDREKRITGRANVNAVVTNWLNIGINTQFSKRNDSGVRPPLDMVYSLSPYAKLYADAAQTVPLPYPVVDQLQFNPLYGPINQKNDLQFYSLQATMYAVVNFPFIKGLSYRFNYNPNFQWQHNYSFNPNYSGNGYNNIGSAVKFNQQTSSWQFENILTYNKRISNDHEFDVTLLYGRNNDYLENTRASASNIFNNSNGWNNLGLGTTQQTTSTSTLNVGLSSMARLNYRFKGKYLVTLTARHDGNSAFGEGHKYGTFPSAALSWIASEESFIKKALPQVDLLKFRASYGSVGNVAVNPYQSLSQFSTTQYVFGDGSGTYTGVFPNTDFMPNPQLGWETTKGLNLAVDFDMYKSRIGGTIEYYDNRTTGLLQQQSVNVVTGYRRQYINIGETATSGLELTLNTVNLRSKNFEWSTNFVFSYSKSKIQHIKYQDGNKDGIEDNDVQNKWIIGQPINIGYDYVFDGIYQTGDALPTGYKPGWIRVKDLNGDNRITPDDRTTVGQLDPKYRYGLTNTLRYGDFTLSFFINANTGYIGIFNQLDVSNVLGQGSFPGRPVNMLNAGYWTPQNASTTRPGLNFTNPLSINYYVSRNFVRLQDVSLSYNVPKTVTNKLGLNNLRVYASGRNVATITNWLGPDPESGNNAVTNMYPTPRILSLGLAVGF